MARIRTSIQRRLPRLRRRRQKEIQVPTLLRSGIPFRYDASLRIAGIGEFHEEIFIKTGISPTKVHRKGEPRTALTTKLWDQDLWILRSPLGEQASLNEHLEWLWKAVSPYKNYFAGLISKAAWADVCLGCLSESAFPVLSASADSLSLTRELNLGLSFNFTCL